MNEIQKLRIKSAMIIYELENSLGNYVIENEILDNITDKSKNSILKRDVENQKASNDDITFLVESSYLDEVFNLAIDVTAGTSLNKHMKDLKDLCTYLGIFDIRNAISHPNRPFPDSYWFKSATIASDPLIEKLGLEKVRQALNSAILENLNSPPEDWYNNVKWAIPNNLPNSFDHEITGLLGRDKEFKDLYATISKIRNNLIAVVAPGGIGKTALILQFLKELSLTPIYSQKISSIIFCTLKNERLTADGIEQIEAINGIEQIKESILIDLNLLYENYSFESFNDACDKLENEKVLICIDNLETLLMHSQNEFIEFNQSLPQQWRVVVTSRISVDSATTVPLEPLVKRHAINLARNYFRKRGLQNIDQPILENIAEMANNNPLAIRLTIDLFNKGVDISQSINQSQKDIALFSYKNLIESLNQNSIAILEATYILTESTKVELTEFLNFSNEEVSESINELSKTSLIIRFTNDFGIDSYQLSDSIRDLLLINPKNIEVRSKISDSLKKLKEKIQLQKTKDEHLGITEFEENYIENQTDRSTHALIVDLNKYFTTNKNHNELSNLKSRFTYLLGYNSKDNQLKYHYSRVLKELSDKPGELKVLEQSEIINPNSPRTIIAIGKHHFYNGDYPIALEVFNRLLEKKYVNYFYPFCKFV
ncbi:MAG: ATP-binding protein, partial [Flavobacterium sp.]